MEWDAPAIVLDARPHGEAHAVVTVLTEEHGLHRGLAHGGGGRSQAALWQAGNLIRARWVARLSDQLGSLSGELVHQPAALALDDRLSLAVLVSACALAEGALPEREAASGRVFGGLLRLLAAIGHGPAPVADAVRWEAALLSDLGFGLDLSACALTGDAAGLAFVSPRTGRAVSAGASGQWKTRLLPLPAFLLDEADPGTPAAWHDGLRLTGHFLARDAFGHRHRPLPQARVALDDLISRMTDTPPDA